MSSGCVAVFVFGWLAINRAKSRALRDVFATISALINERSDGGLMVMGRDAGMA